jgi:FkbM family methyltransferase
MLKSESRKENFLRKVSWLRRLYEFLFRKLRGKGFGLGIFNFIHSTLWAKNLKPDFIDIHGMRIYVSRDDTALSDTLVMEKDWEPQTTLKLKSLLKPGMTFLDIGANIGYFTVLASRLVGPNGRVFAFEPEIKNIEFLLRNLRANQCQNVVVYPYAVSSKLGYAPLYLAPNSTGHSLFKDQGHLSSPAAVVTIRLDDFFNEAAPDFIKMDIEGGEWDAFLGMEKLLSNQNLKNIIFEHNFAPKGASLDSIAEKLGQYGFKIAPPLDGNNHFASRI